MFCLAPIHLQGLRRQPANAQHHRLGPAMGLTNPLPLSDSCLKHTRRSFLKKPKVLIQSHLLIKKQRESKPPPSYIMFLYGEWFPTGPGVYAPQVVGHPVGPESPRRTENGSRLVAW